MIELVIEDYCQNCNMFEADVDRIRGYSDGRKIYTDTTISCKNKDLCNNMKNYLKKEIINERNLG